MFHGIFLGVGAHKDSRLPKVPSARRDAEAMYAVVSRATIDEQRHLTLLVDQRVTKAALGRFLGEELPSRVTIKDTVLIYLAGLGTVDPSDGSMLLLTHESAADKPRAQSIEVIAEMMLWMRRMSARIVTLILDASFATGAGPATGLRTLDLAPPSSPTPSVGSAATSARSSLRPRNSSQPPARRWPAPAIGDRLVVLCAAGEEEPAVHDDRGEHGLFTRHLLHTIAKAPERSAVSPAHLHLETTMRIHDAASMGAKPQSPMLIGADSTKGMALFRAPQSVRAESAR